MTLKNEEVIETLDKLIATCRDAEAGFRLAATEVEAGHLKSLFDSYCQQRAQLGAELQQTARRLGGNPVDSGTTRGAVHRGWLEVKSAIRGRDAGAILSECERGEDFALEEYQDALNTDLPTTVRQIVSRQYAAVKAAHDRIRELEKSCQSAESTREH